MPITIKEITAHDHRALFYAADLHIHSYGASEDVTDKTLTIESIVDNAFKHSIGVLSITDHNTARNVAPSIEYAASMPAKCSSLPARPIHQPPSVYVFPPEHAGRIQIF